MMVSVFRFFHIRISGGFIMGKIFRSFTAFVLFASFLSVPNGIVRADNPKPSLRVV